MRNYLHFSLALASTAMLFYSCTKIDNQIDPEIEAGAASRQAFSQCQAISFQSRSASAQEVQYTTAFKKQFDPSSGKLSQVLAGISQGGIVDSIYFTVKWTNRTVAFLRNGSISDTVLVANLDRKGSVTSVRQGNTPDDNYLPTYISYKNNKVSALRVSFMGSSIISKFYYDLNGNCIRIQDNRVDDGVPPRIDYQYNTAVKATQQVYQDEPRRFIWNTFSLLEYAGLLPQLQNENLRTRTMVTWDDNYIAYDFKMMNHQIDGQGVLLKYDVADPITNEVLTHHTIGWNCNQDNGLVQ